MYGFGVFKLRICNYCHGACIKLLTLRFRKRLGNPKNTLSTPSNSPDMAWRESRVQFLQRTHLRSSQKTTSPAKTLSSPLEAEVVGEQIISLDRLRPQLSQQTAEARVAGRSASAASRC